MRLVLYAFSSWFCSCTSTASRRRGLRKTYGCCLQEQIRATLKLHARAISITVSGLVVSCSKLFMINITIALGIEPTSPASMFKCSQSHSSCESHDFSCACVSVTLFQKCPYGPVKPDQLHIHHPPHSLCRMGSKEKKRDKKNLLKTCCMRGKTFIHPVHVTFIYIPVFKKE